MIQSLYKLGRALATNPENEHYFASYADPFAGFDGEAIVVVIEINNDKVTGYNLESYQRGNAGRYLFRKPKGARGAPLVATGPFYPVHSLETDKQRQTQAENVDKILSRLDRSFDKQLDVYFSGPAAKRDSMVAISKILNEFTGAKENRYIYTAKVNGKYLGEYEALQDLLDDEAYTKYYEKSKGTGTCALSHEQDVEVWGRIDTLGFTVKEVTFNRGGFDDKKSFRMFPVSRKAALALEAARRFAFSQLTDRFYTLEYMILPRMLEGDPKALLSIANKMKVSASDNTLTRKSAPIMKADGKIDLVTEDEDILRSGVLVDLLFYQRNQAQIALLLHLQDISPTRLGELKAAVNVISNRYGKAFGFTDKKTNEFKPFRVGLGVVKNFFSTGKGLKVAFDPFFYRLLEAMFHAQTIPESTVVTALIDKIRFAFKNDGDDYHTPFHTTVYQAITTRGLLGELGLFNNIQPTFMDSKPQPISLQREDFIASHEAFFKDQPALKGAFLTGVLTSILTYAQYKRLNSKPFLNKLNNLNLGIDELRRLVPQLLNKIQQYQQGSGDYKPNHVEVTNLTAEASDLLMSGGRASRDDLSFAFAAGMVMQDKFALAAAQRAKAAKIQDKS